MWHLETCHYLETTQLQHEQNPLEYYCIFHVCTCLHLRILFFVNHPQNALEPNVQSEIGVNLGAWCACEYHSILPCLRVRGSEGDRERDNSMS